VVKEHGREPGVPYTAFAQLLESGAISADHKARFLAIMAREGAEEEVLSRPDGQAPARWFKEVYPELDIDQATRLGQDFAEHVQLTSFGPLSLPLISAGSVAEVVELFAYLPLITTAVATRVRPQQDGPGCWPGGEHGRFGAGPLSRHLLVRGHEKVPTGGQVAVPSGGQN
jgi:hypothetical protein